MTEAILRATKLGVIINKLSKSATADVSTIKIARDLVSEWKNAMRPGTPVSNSSAISSTTFNTTKNSPVAAQATVELKISNEATQSNGVPPPSTPIAPFELSSEMVNKLKDFAEGRKKMVSKFSECMSMNTTDAQYAFAVGCDIEHAVHDTNSYDFPDTRKAYSEKCRTLLLNLKRNEVIASIFILKFNCCTEPVSVI